MKKESKSFFSDLEPWKKEWTGMPEYNQRDKTPIQSILIHFESEKDREDFAKLINQKITSTTKFLWFPKLKKMNLLNRICTDES